VYGALVGQAVGDALGAPTEGLTRAQIVERYWWVSDFVDDDPAGTDDTEYAVLTARLMLAHGWDLTPAEAGPPGPRTWSTRWAASSAAGSAR